MTEHTPPPDSILTASIQLANELWPTEGTATGNGSEESDDDGGADDLEKQVAKEVASMKRPRRETRFGMSPYVASRHLR